MRTLIMAYNLTCYFIGVLALVLLILFMGDFLIPITINNASSISPELPVFTAMVVNIGLIVL